MNKMTYMEDTDEGKKVAGQLKREEIAGIKKDDREEAKRYVVWGAITVLINISIFYFFAQVLRVEYQISNLIAWFASVQCSFWFDKVLVFKHKSKHVMHDMSKFYGTRILTFLIESFILWLGISVFGFHEVITKVVGHGLAVVGNYFLSKLVIFKKVTNEENI
ncbi:GtrA family protein [Lactiplantibacillus plantarum]|uniref:GtrA family protein n=1 Tax=Lactiplantibacillus plantarum TaxID=1590 RepID=UPI001BA5B57B|nr:GtrA family protein [Lactiplantibacillus plantarum]MBS0938050.1 GtrA family protein [Lactiplantibacillus plantarum]MBS0945853.1 GtrA family protein [Lactiplantibacillus plantarum]